MIVQGLLRLMEKNIKLRCREEDNDVVDSILEDAISEYQTFIKEKTGKDYKCEITVVKSVPLKDSDTK
jgi:ATP synthase (E/31 kDa) subunit